MSENIPINNANETSAFNRFPSLKAGAVLLLFIAGACVVYFSPLLKYFENIDSVRQHMAGLGWLAPVFYVAVSALLGAVGFSRLALCVAAGVLFGFINGLILGLAGTLTGAYIMFLFVRWGGRDLIVRRWPKVTEISRLPEHFGIPAVFALRQIPVSGIILNSALAVSPVSHRHFLIGSLAGFIPAAVPSVMAGAGVLHSNSTIAVATIAASIVLLGVVWHLTARYTRRLTRVMSAKTVL